MDADQLILEWARGKFPEWAYVKLRNLQRDILLSRGHAGNWLASWAAEGAVLGHLVNCPDLKATSPKHDWECGCYSEYTRGDEWVVHVTFECGHITGYEWRQSMSYGFGLPDVLYELAQLDETLNPCIYDEEQ